MQDLSNSEGRRLSPFGEILNEALQDPLEHDANFSRSIVSNDFELKDINLDRSGSYVSVERDDPIDV